MAIEEQTIEVVSYDPEWPDRFSEQAQEITEVLGANCREVHHVGSTSVPGLAAKPKLDILTVVVEPEQVAEPLRSIGYRYKGEFNLPFRHCFGRRGVVDVNLHVVPVGHPEIELNLMFRDYLRQNPAIRDEYAQLKLSLLESPASFQKQGSMFTGYNHGKDALIRRVLQAAGYEGVRLVLCTHDAEWAAARSLRQRYFFDKVPVQDPYEWTFDHADHHHVGLTLGVEMIGYAHVQCWPESRAAMRIIVVDEGHRGRGYGRELLARVEKWLATKLYRSLHVEASPDAVAFYRRQGYTEMPFSDPTQAETDPRDLPMGKLL